jgi:AcrR family transcriptional regulator
VEESDASATYIYTLTAFSHQCKCHLHFPMTLSRSSARQRLIQAAIELFTAQGVTETTTRQIAESAEVNEVTLFRHFGNKQGLLLAVIEEAAVFDQLGETLVQQASRTDDLEQVLKDYGNAFLEALEQVPELVRSVVGEAGQYSTENQEALGRGFTQANRCVAEYLETVIDSRDLQFHLSAEKLAGLLNGLLLGYAITQFTSEFQGLWHERQDFLDHLVILFLQGAVSHEAIAPIGNVTTAKVTEKVTDLPAQWVHEILQQAKRQSLQTYAWVYVLFGAGLSPMELARLQRSHHSSDRDQQLLQVAQGLVRQVPVNQWILGKRYGNYLKNPLTQWLKSRKDQHSALFINANQEPLTEADFRQQWQELCQEFPWAGRQVAIEQAQHTWCIELLMRGMSLEDMQILTGWQTQKLEVYARRAREKIALEQAIKLDQKN